MNYFCENYDPDVADAMKASYEEEEDVEVTTASRLHAYIHHLQKNLLMQ
jgi:hypothetical protein